MAEYTAFETLEYRTIIVKLERDQPWIDMAQSFYYASEHLVEGVLTQRLSADIEGMTAIFLFRHYLELTLKRIVMRGRWLARVEASARPEAVDVVPNIHDLSRLWSYVVSDAKPKIAPEDWEKYDTAFVEKCIAEFDLVDKKGFTFRYPGQGGERCTFDFGSLRESMSTFDR